MPSLHPAQKPTPVGDLKSVDGIAIDPKTEKPFSGEAYLNFFDGQLRMQGMYEKGKNPGFGNITLKAVETVFIIFSLLTVKLYLSASTKMTADGKEPHCICTGFLHG